MINNSIVLGFYICFSKLIFLYVLEGHFSRYFYQLYMGTCEVLSK